jgi:Tfp pilus assembly protein PilW
LTLVEMMVATALMSLAVGALLILSSSTGRSLAEMVNYVDLDHYNRVALDTMTREIRQARSLVSFSKNKLTFEEFDGTSLVYTYSPTDQALKRRRGTEPERVILEQCDDFEFGMYQRNPLAKTYKLIPTTSTATCKVITITWSCSRTLFRAKANTEQGQAAKIVLRNKM